jgi:hypothetical protein
MLERSVNSGGFLFCYYRIWLNSSIQLMDVFREIGGYFLASPITRRRGTLVRKERTIGWIRADLCVKVTRPPHPLCEAIVLADTSS